MANLILNVTIGDIDVPVAAAGFLRKCPMPQIEDPNNPTQMIDEFSSTRAWVEEWLKRDLLRAVNAGIDELQKDLGQRLTQDIFVQE